MLKWVFRSLGARAARDDARLKKNRRLAALHLLQGEADTITYRVEGTVWTTHAHGTITRRLFAGRGHHAAELSGVLAWLAGNGRPVDLCTAVVNVGANVGSIALPLAQTTGLRVVAVEPDPENFGLLQQNVRQNELGERIYCVNAAVTSEPGEAWLATTSDPAWSEVETAGAKQGWGERAPDGRVRVPAQTLEGILAELAIAPAAIGLVWSDTQGHEGQVVESGRALWAAGVPLFAELWPPGLRTHGDVDAFVATMGAHFDRFVLRDPLREKGAEAPTQAVDRLADVLADLGEGHTDALFLPRTFGAAPR